MVELDCVQPLLDSECFTPAAVAAELEAAEMLRVNSVVLVVAGVAVKVLTTPALAQ